MDKEFTNDVTICVYDNGGKLVLKEVLRGINNEVRLDTSSLRSGSYQYIIRSGANYSIGKFIVSK